MYAQQDLFQEFKNGLILKNKSKQFSRFTELGKKNPSIDEEVELNKIKAYS